MTQYLALGIWILLLVLQYAFVRYVCRFGIPEDCKDKADAVQVMEDLQYLVFPGSVLAIMTGMHWPDRLEYIFSFGRSEPRGWWFLLAYFGFGFFWSCLHLVPALGKFTLTELKPEFALPLLAVAVGAVFVLGWHFRAAYKHNSTSGFAAYLLSRGAMLSFYLAYLIIKLRDEADIVFHFHHYAFGFVAASFAEFNHPISILLLACGTAVFVQGLSAYGAETIIGHHMFRVVIQEANGTTVYSPSVDRDAVDFFNAHCHYV